MRTELWYPAGFPWKKERSAQRAGLILACLDRGLHPGWDAHDLRSAALAQKLGYRMEGPYQVFLRIG